MRILVTGATGFVGKNLIPKLLEKDKAYEVTIEPEKSKKLRMSIQLIWEKGAGRF